MVLTLPSCHAASVGLAGFALGATLSGKSSLREAPKKPFPHVCVCPWFRLMVKKGVFGGYWMHFPLHSGSLEQVDKGGRQTTTL